MLKTGFLGLLSDWVSEQTARDEAAMEKATQKFGLEKLLAQTDEPEKIIGLFSEWMVFDCKQELFNGHTGLEAFVAHNPYNAPEQELSAYKDLLFFEVGLFEVKSIERGKGVLLVSIISGAERFIHDVNASLSLRVAETVWGRVAPVGGLYHGVGCIFFVLPMRVKEGMREAMRTWKRNSFDAKEVAGWVVAPGKDKPFAPPLYDESMWRFEQALKKCGMNGFFSIETFAEWASDEKKYDMDFASRALDCLIPDDVEFKDTAELIQSSGEFSNNIPRMALGGKTPNEVSRERQNKGETGDWEMNMLSKESYIKKLEQASEYMARGEFEKSYKAFDQVVKDLLKDKLPFFHAFRVYANAAVCCFHKGDIQLGEALLDAALRINPMYEFAERQKERYLADYDPTRTEKFATFSKKGQKMLKGMRDDMRATGKRMYQHRVFSKYEKLLKELGVSLAYRAKVKPMVYSFDKDGKPKKMSKVGRNEPCPCGKIKADGSPVKYKRCHGA